MMIMEKQNSFKAPKITLENPKKTMEKQISFKTPPKTIMENPKKTMEKQWSFRGILEKQKSFKIAMEKQVSFGGGGSEGKKESPGKRGDSPLHLAARGGNLTKIKNMFRNCESDEVKKLIVTQNQDGETCLYVAAENGHVLVVSEFMRYLDIDSASIASTRNGFDAFHVAAKEGHTEVLKEFLRVLPNLAMTTASKNSTALHTAAAQGRVDVVNLLLEFDSNLAKINLNNGKTVLHSAARFGYLEVVKSLLDKDPTAGSRVDRKGQTALHMAVKGQKIQHVEIVTELLRPDPAVINLEDSKGNTALHIATAKGRAQMVCCLLSIESINVNAINKNGDSALDIAEKTGNQDIIAMLKKGGASNSKDLGKPQNPAKQLKQTVSDIKHDVESQIQQTHRTRVRVHKIKRNLKKLHASGLNNAITSATVVAVLIATIAFAAIFQVPGQWVEQPGPHIGEANIATHPAFLIFFVSDSMALFISLAVVVVQISVVVIEQKAKKKLMFVINKFMWLACSFISVAFISLSYVVVGQNEWWLAAIATAIGSIIMVATIGSLCYFIVTNKLDERSIRRSGTQSRRSFPMSVGSDLEISDGGYKPVYAL